MKTSNLENKGIMGRKTGDSCIWRATGAVSAQTCESRPDDCEGCPVYISLAKVSGRSQKKFFSRDYFDWCSVNACAVPGSSCPFAGPCMANWSRTNAPAQRVLTLMGIGSLSVGANASLIQQTARRTGLHSDLLGRIFELKNLGMLGSEEVLSPDDLDLSTTEEQFAMVAVASFLDCLDSLDLPAFAETMFENALLPCGLSESVSGDRRWEDLWSAFRAIQGLAVLDVISAFDISVLREMQATMATSSYSSLIMAQMALTVQRAIQPYTHRPPGLEAGTLEHAATLVSFADGMMGKVYNGLIVTIPELAAAVIIARALGAISDDGAIPAGRIFMEEIQRMDAKGPVDMTCAQPILAGIVASGFSMDPEERTMLSRTVLRSFQTRFRRLGDMRADPVSFLACLGADNLVRESDQFSELSCVEVPDIEKDPALLGCEMPVDRFYCHGHAWVKPGRESAVRIGLDDLAAHLIGRIDAVKMPKPGKRLRRGKRALRLIRGGESVDVFSPMNGEVESINRSIVDSPDILPSQPYEDGWLLTMRPEVSEDNVSGLMSGQNAIDWQREEARKLGEMFQGKMATAADGATLANDALADIAGVRWSRVLRRFFRI